MGLSLTTKNATIAILIAFDLMFFIGAVSLYLLAATRLPTLKDLADKVWTVFMAANGSVGLALSIESKRNDSSAADGTPATPTK